MTKGMKHASATANDRQVGGDHYMTEDGIQHWDLFGPDYLIGYATKYMRWRKKGGVEDLEKAIHVVEKLKEIVTEANLPEYDRSCVLRWQNAVGLDFVERMIVDRIMFMRGRSDLDLAIDGIRYLIEQSKNIVDPSVNGSGINYLTLDQYSPETLRFEMNRLKRANDASRGWGAAVGARLESIKEIESELARRERRVPRFGAEGGHVRGPLAGEGRSLVEMLTPDAGHPPVDTPSCGDGTFDAHQRARATKNASHPRSDDAAQHASLFPWCMTKDQWQATFAGRIDLAKDFYREMGTGFMRLEAHVESERLPRELHVCYHAHSANGKHFWTLAMAKLPEALRDQYPRLWLEVNVKEYEDLPEWQRQMYGWHQGESKYRLTPGYAAWADKEN